MVIIDNTWSIFAPNNTLASLRDLMDEICRQICEYRESVPIVPELCLPTAAKEISLTPLIMQAAYNLHRNEKAVFWPVSEMTATRSDKGSKGRIDIGLFSKRHATFIECKAVRSSATNRNNNKIENALDIATKQLLDIDMEELLFNSPTETKNNIRANNKLIPMVAVNVTCNKNRVESRDRLFMQKVDSIRDNFPNSMIVQVKYRPHYIRCSGDMNLNNENRKLMSIGHVFILTNMQMRFN
ncbi:hypothetical protein AVL57_00735 (plasmid) [Alteromonas stellipolaris]|uniref:Restriction endonuclease n=2 Tax=Alteromonas stellipolaris TaxID=233316 RepID=A0ABM5YPZ9_9ALTE|nr:hypothetical protein AVL57_00735 [Alteromonas stellipolaris]